MSHKFTHEKKVKKSKPLQDKNQSGDVPFGVHMATKMELDGRTQS